MPTYEYTCKTCGENFEVFQSFSDKSLKKHQGCGGPLQKVFHARGIVFKGSGFYATDAKGSSSKGEDAERSSKDSTKKEPKAGSKTETKTETKTEPKKATAAAD